MSLLWLASVVAAVVSGTLALRVHSVVGMLATAVAVAAIAAAAAGAGRVSADLGISLAFAGVAAAGSALAKLMTRLLDTPSAGRR